MNRSPRPGPRFAALALGLLAAPLAAHDMELPDGFELVELGTWISGIPVDLEFLPDGRMFVATKDGHVLLLQTDGTQQAVPFLNLEPEVLGWGDRGLLGLALHPGFVPDGGPSSWVYLLYTVAPTGVDEPFDENGVYKWSRLTRYRAITLPLLGVFADPASRQVLLGDQLPDGRVPDGIASLHNSHSNGVLTFGADGTLLVTTGEGAHWDYEDFGGNDPPGFDNWVHPVTGLVGPTPIDQDSGSFRSQDLRSLSGKVLRLDPETGLGLASNPFFDGDPASLPSRVWALGLRNPFRACLVPGTGSSDPALGDPGELLIADVGFTKWEELDRCTGGENFGWPCWEGPSQPALALSYVQPPNPYGYPDCSTPIQGTLTPPFFYYHHTQAAWTWPAGIHFDHDGNLVPTGFTGSAPTALAVYAGGDYPPEYTGSVFLADFGQDWVRRLVLDATGQPVELHDFIDAVDNVADLERHPLTGEIYLLSTSWSQGQLNRLRYSTDLTPTAVAQADVASGPGPLTVQFDGSASSDPEGLPLTFRWDFGDGSPLSNLVAPQHVFTAGGIYQVELEVEDPGGNLDQDTGTIAVGFSAPVVTITTPGPSSSFTAPAVFDLQAVASDQDGEPLTWQWTVDEYHETHVHPAVGSGTSSGSFSYAAAAHGSPTELVYYRIEAKVTDPEGLDGTDHVFLYPASKLRDVTGSLPPIAKIEASGFPGPGGSGNADIEVVRDAVAPPVGSTLPVLQYDTYTQGAQGSEDWIGFVNLDPVPAEWRFVGLTFQEGLHAAGGGWWQDLRVQVRTGGSWITAEELAIDPPYPFELAGTPGFDGISFDTYELTFDPIRGDAIRLIGTPGGTDGFMSAAELRVRAVFGDPPGGLDALDVTADGVPSSKVQGLTPPVPLGAGNTLVSTIANGTFAPPGSASAWVQYDTFHNGDQGPEDWFALEFPVTWEFRGMRLQEGLNDPAAGGWLENPTVQVRAQGGLGWVDVTGLTSSPPFPGDTQPSASFETFELAFDPIPGRELRILGTPGGAAGYSSVAELRALATVAPPYCGWTVVGPGPAPGDTLRLHSWSVPQLGGSSELELVGLGEPGLAWLGFALGTSSLPLAGGTLLLDPWSARIILSALVLDAEGEAALTLPLPASPALLAADFAFQAVAVPFSAPTTIEFSNALVLRLCP